MDFSQSEVWLGNVGKVSRKLRRNLTQNPWVLTSLKVDITLFFEQGDAIPTHPRNVICICLTICCVFALNHWLQMIYVRAGRLSRQV